MLPSERRHATLDVAERNRQLTQWDQPGDSTTGHGERGCTHACICFLELLIHGNVITQDDVSRLMSPDYPTNDQLRLGKGPTGDQVEGALQKLHLPYRAVYNEKMRDLIQVVRHRGPVIVGVNYAYQPQRSGTVYQGQRADGRPNGYARPPGVGGNTQIGSRFTHAEVLLAARWRRRRGRYDVFVKDPNHGSPARGEHPEYDILTASQLERAYEAARAQFVDVQGRSYTYCVWPTKPVSIFDGGKR